LTDRILIVEDDPAIRNGLERALLKGGYDVSTRADAESAEALLAENGVDLLVLDVMLPGRSGLELCKRLRASGSDLPVLMLTALSDESDKILGLDLGADDYLTKPFSLGELQARIRALLRRSPFDNSAPSTLTFGDVEIDFLRFRATKAGQEVHLPPKGFGVLQALAEREGAVMTRDDLLATVWGYDTMPTTRTVDNHVAQLRSRLEDDPAEPRFIQTVFGVGYCFSRGVAS
jgi:DNA-binding response OmpR family regulator